MFVDVFALCGGFACLILVCGRCWFFVWVLRGGFVCSILVLVWCWVIVRPFACAVVSFVLIFGLRLAFVFCSPLFVRGGFACLILSEFCDGPAFQVLMVLAYAQFIGITHIHFHAICRYKCGN